MRVLIACEYSGVIREAFAKRGHDAWSCDLLDTEIPSDKHHKGDVLEFLENDSAWDLLIAHPPCTYLSNSGAKWYYHPDDKHLPTDQRRPHPKYPNRQKDKQDAVNFFMKFVQLSLVIPKVCIENPVGIMSRWNKPTQIIQPYHFGHKEAKATCLWLFNLPKLTPTQIMEPDYITTPTGRKHCPWYSNNKKERSKTFSGISEAMSSQWT